MKTQNKFSLLLQKLCNQRSVVKSTSGFNGYKLVGLLTLFLLLSFQQAKADYFWQYTDYFKITGTTNNGWLDIQIIGIDTYGDNDRMEDCTLKYSEDNGLTYKDLMNFNILSNSLDGSCTDLTTGQNYVNGKIVKPSPLYSYEGDLAYCKVKWYYPASVVGKSLKFRIEGIWYRNYATSSRDRDYFNTGDYYYKTVLKNVSDPIVVPAYNPSTSFSLAPNPDGKYLLTWNNASYLTRFELYSDAGFTNLAGTVTSSSSSGSGSVKLGLFNMTNKYYVKQIYTTPSSPAGFSITYEKKFTTPISNVGIKYPIIVSNTYSPSNENVTLKWTEGNSIGQLVKYHIKRNDVFITPTAGLSDCNFTDTPITHWTNYTYIIYAIPTTSGWTRDNALISELSTTVQVSTSPIPPNFKDFKLIAHPTNGTIQPYMEVNWDNNQWVSQNVVKLYHRASTSVNYTLLGTMASGTSTYSDNTVTDNSKHFYKLEVNVFGQIYSQIDSETVIKKVAFKSIKASKNTIGDRIQLNWEIDRLDLCDRFEIYRSYSKDSMGVDVQSSLEMVNQLSAQTVYNSWDDRTAAPGTVYQYMIKAYKTGLDGLLRISYSNTDIGFRMPAGTVTGRITYSGGTAVGNVSLYVNSSSLDNNLLYKSLKFNADASQKAEIGLTKAQHGCIKNGFSFQSWITSSRSKTYTPVIEVSKEYSIGLRNDSVLVFIGSTLNINSPSLKCKLDETITENNYFHLSVTLESNDSLKVYLNGIPKNSAFTKVPHTSTCSFVDEVLDLGTGNVTTARTKSYLGNKTDAAVVNESAFSGNIDDIRLWSRGITAAEISGNYNRYLGGNESGLIGYWPLDEGINSNAFDCSKTNQTYNEHHIKLIKTFTSTAVPTKEQLAIKGITDGDGNYIIRGIPFSGDGSTFSIQPLLGTHKFEPSQQACYISQTSLVHDAQNFEDKSSFPVKVKVTYENSTYPVEGVSFYVDENPCIVESTIIKTDSKGVAVLDVPIGQHYIRAQLYGHDFKYNGRYPVMGKVDITQAFGESTQAKGISFIDTTKVIVAGRVTGGVPQSKIPVGFGRKVTVNTAIANKSVANIGQATIVLQPAKYATLYNLNDTTVTRNMYTDAARFNSTASVVPDADKITIKTDPVTGEYMVKVPPIDWTVNSVTTTARDNSTIDVLNGAIQSFTTSPLVKDHDTLTIENEVDTFTYNVKRNFVYRVEPTVEVTDISYPNAPFQGAFGEYKYYVKNALTNKKDSVYFYDKNLVYKYGNPIFIQSMPYTFQIKAFERYYKSNTDSTDVPLSGASVTALNEIGKLQKLITGDPGTIPEHDMTLNSNGFIYYQFTAGFPNMTDISGGLSLNITLQYNNEEYPWKKNGTFYGIVLGSEPISGNNFVTNGPLVPLVVLRDPPGSNSYAYMETGTSLSYSISSQNNFNQSSSLSGTLKNGPSIKLAYGIGISKIEEAETTAEVTVGLQENYAHFNASSNQKTLTLTERIQTSSSPDFVGSNADVYIGTSTNVVISESNILDIEYEAGQFILKKTVGSRGNTIPLTEFRFSQNEILTGQIPMWRNQFAKYLIKVTPEEYNSRKGQSSVTTTNQYITYLDPSDAKYGVDPSTYSVLRPAANKKLKDEVDSIATQIKNWQNVIKANESTKYLAKTDTKTYDKTNISFDAGASVERSYTLSNAETNSNGNSISETGSVGGKVGFTYDGLGVEINTNVSVGGGHDSGSESTTEKTVTFGYVLADSDPDNRFSINVYRNNYLASGLDKIKKDITSAEYAENSLGSYIFEVAGGQTSCPYERVDSSLFYTNKNKLVQLGNGTQAIEAPFIRIKSNTKTDIPTGKDASYILELSSNSIVRTSRAYMLSVDDASNKDGAIISIDGTPLTGGRLFYVAPGEILTKTLTLHQTKQDVLNYHGIKLLFSSPCDNSINAEQLINATYVPSCSDIDLSLDNLTLNSETGSNLLLNLKNFNQEYKNFLGLCVEYKMEGETNWHTKTFAKNARTRNLITNGADMLLPDSTSSSFAYSLSFDGLADGNYTVRAKTLCQDGINIINNITPEFSIIKDMVLPTAMGQPSPSNGILTPETEVSVTFNENIQTGKLVSDNFEVKGVLNGVALQHAEGLNLNGTSNSEAFTESPITLQNSSFAIESWIRTTADCNTLGNIFTIGIGADKVMLNMKKDAVEVSVNDQVVGSKSIVPVFDWQYISLNYNANTQQLQVHLMSSNTGSTIISTKLASPVSPIGRLMVGSGFKGNINQVVVWNESRSIQDLSDMNESKSGKETNIIGYWPMDEAYGTIAVDKVRSRNMTVNSSWFVEPSGYSASFNGTDQSLSVKTATIPLTNKDNFSIEFWFKGNAQTNKTIFSCGKGVGDIDSSEKLSIGINNSGELNLNSKGNTFIVPNTNVLDDAWHHFALSVLRSGNSNIYIDGQQKLQITSGKIGGLASDMISLGSRRFTDSTIVDSKKVLISVQDQYFNGKLDEVRIWNSALGAENFRLDMRSKLTGAESGLIAYYPFEETTEDSGGILQITPSFNDCSSKKSGTGVYKNLTGLSSNTETPGIKVPRPKEDVSFSYTASDNKIIFNINAPLAKIENCILEFAINKVYDMNGNKIGSPIKWTAFVNNNRLNWETEAVTITKQVLAAYTFKAVIVNNSGKYENFVIDGLPGWLSVNVSSGRLNPLEKKELIFTVDNSTNIGSYECRIILTGNNNMQDLLPVSLKVTGTRPDWSVDPYAYESSMNVIGQIKIDGVYQEDPEDILAAFIGTRCVGIVNPRFDKTKNSYILYMDIYGNDSDTGAALTFSLWDAGTGRIYPAVDVVGSPISFVGTSIIGTITNPQLFNATDKVEQQLTLKQGWNWISTNVVNTQTPLINQFKSGIETAGIQLKSRDGFIGYSAGSWNGNDITLNQTTMYMVKMNQAKTLKLVGSMAKQANLPITINRYWNWIGYVPQFVAPVKDALSALNSQEGDQIKGQVGFLSYSGGAWYGSLQYMNPGLGYMYYSNNATSSQFNYPSQYISQSKVAQQTNENQTSRWTVDVNKYQMNMTIIATASINGNEVSKDNMQLGVFIGNECRGTAELKYVDAYQRYMAFPMVLGNTEDINKKVTFKLYNSTNNQEVIALESLTFVPDNIIGTVVNPYQITSLVSGYSELNVNSLKVYPNPVIDFLHFDCDPSGIDQFDILDNLGRVLISKGKLNKNSFDVGSLVPGVYTLRMKYNGNVSNHLFIKK